MAMGLGPESERSLYLGLVRTIPGFFVLIAPLIGGVIIESVSYRAMFLTALGLGVVGVALLRRVKTHPVSGGNFKSSLISYRINFWWDFSARFRVYFALPA